MKFKRGQVSIFVIIGLVIIAIVGLLVLAGTRTESGFLQEARAEDVQDYLESCVNDAVASSAGNPGFKGDSGEAGAFLEGYLKKSIKTSCEKDIKNTFSNVEEPSEIFLEVEVEEIDYTSLGSSDPSSYVNPSTGQNLYIYEKAVVKLDYAARVNVDGNFVTLDTILVEHEF